MSDQPTAAVVKSNVPPLPIVPDRPPTALLASEQVLEQIMAIAKMAVAGGSDMIPQNIKTAPQAAAVMLAGYEIGLRPWTALRHMYIVNGKTEIETRAMVGIVRARDPRIAFEWPEYKSDAVTCILRRPGQKPITVRYTLADANASGQTRKKKKWIGEGQNRKQVEVNGPWQLYPRDMLYAAATKRACRLGAPDLINAIETRAIATDIIDTEYQIIDDVPPSEDPGYNAGDAPGAPLTPEVRDATGGDADEAEWRSLGDYVDENAPVPAAAAAPAEDPDDAGMPAEAPTSAATTAPTDEDLLSGARELLRAIVKDYAPQNVKQLMTKFAGKKTAAGNPAFTQYTRAELEQAIEAMREFVAGAVRQGALDA